MNNEETPETDEAIVAQLKASEGDASCLCGEDHADEVIPGLDGLMDYLVQQFSAADPAELESRAAHLYAGRAER